MSFKILIIEDNALNLELAADLLKANNFAILEAQTAEDGLRIASEQNPDLILMDLSLPKLDGLTATRALKDNPTTSHIKVVALTAHAMKGDCETALRAGCDGYLSKPIDTRTFARQIAAFLEATSSLSTAKPF
jgi:CheY-like chemotaxis protein